MASFAETIRQVEEGFLIPFYTFLDTGVNTIKTATYINLHHAIIHECNRNDRADSVHRYLKKILLEYCRDRMVASMIDLKEDALLNAWLKSWDTFKVFTHSLGKMFAYLNQFFLENAHARKIAEECL